MPDINAYLPLIIQGATQIVVAIIIWIVGRWLIGFVTGMIRKALERAGRFDKTIINFLASAISTLLTIMLVLGILSFFGIETTTFAALLGGVGLAVGAAWGGLLGHLAAGLFMLVLRPFKVGDFVTAGGVTGTVKELGLFGTTIDTPDNVRTIVGNNTVFGGTIQNFTANPYQRVVVTAQIDDSADEKAVMKLLEERARAIPNVLTDPAPACAIAELKPAGPVLGLAVFTANSNYWQVYFDATRMIKQAFTDAGVKAPEETIRMIRD
jgi:small conductance mechanosensitive channel